MSTRVPQNNDPSIRNDRAGHCSRREMLAAGLLMWVSGGRGLLGQDNQIRAGREASAANPVRFRYCLNTGTIRGQKRGIVEEIDLAARAGYDALEPWVAELSDYQKEGGSLSDLRKRLQDANLTVESAIEFAPWIVDDPDQRARGIEQLKRSMDLLAQVGGKRIAAPPVGATQGPQLDLLQAAERYRAILELADQTGVVPQIEVWGFSRNLHRLGQSMFVAIESGHPRACLLPDVYHIYKGGSDFHGLKLISGRAIQVFHMNDYPANPPRERIGDRDRVMPGDGIAPLGQILQDLARINPEMVLSLELFNPEYWKQDPASVAQLGLRKMKAAVEKAFG